MDVGMRLAALRKKCGYTQNGLAERAGVSQTHLRRAERGEADITVGHLQLLCCVFIIQQAANSSPDVP